MHWPLFFLLLGLISIPNQCTQTIRTMKHPVVATIPSMNVLALLRYVNERWASVFVHWRIVFLLLPLADRWNGSTQPVVYWTRFIVGIISVKLKSSNKQSLPAIINCITTQRKVLTLKERCVTINHPSLFLGDRFSSLLSLFHHLFISLPKRTRISSLT